MSLVNELIKGLLPEEEKKKVVAVYGGGFKPPTSGHFAVVKQALKENPEIDEFIILIGGKPRNGITPDESILIWDIYKQYLPFKVEVKYTSVPPIKGIYNYAKDHPDEEVLFIIGAREGNEEDFKDIASRTTTLDKYPNLNLRTIVTQGGVSGTAARNASKISLDKFKPFVPSELSDEEVEQVYNIVADKITENITEGKQVGTLYHYTSADGLKGILQSNSIRASKEYYLGNDIYFVSFTRNKNFHKKGSAFDVKMDYRITLDGDKLSNKYKIKPFAYIPGWNYKDNWEYEWLDDEPESVVRDFLQGTGDYDEQEERISFKKPGGSITNIKDYILKVDKISELTEGRKKKKDPKKGTGKKPEGSKRRLYTDEDPKDTIGIKFSTRQDIVDTLNKTSFKAKSHARQSQIINLIHQRVRAAYGRAKDPAVRKRLKTGLDYITKKKEASKKKTQRLNKLKEGDTYEKMAAKGKKAGSLKQGTVRKRLGIAKDKKIPLSKINKEISRLKKMDKDPDKKGAQLGDKNQKYYKALQLAKTLKTTTNVNENASYSKEINIKEKIAQLTSHMIDKGMNIEPLPSLKFVDGDSENAKDFFGKTAYYDPNTQTVVLYTEGRHPKDIVRSYAHEMIHHIQYLEDRLGGILTTNTTEDDHLDKIEQEANLRGTMTFRNWTDSILNEAIVGEKIECDSCGWSWNIVDGGDDLFICHKCGHDNESLNEVKPYKHKHGFNDKLGKDPFGLNQFAREIAEEIISEGRYDRSTNQFSKIAFEAFKNIHDSGDKEGTFEFSVGPFDEDIYSEQFEFDFEGYVEITDNEYIVDGGANQGFDEEGDEVTPLINLNFKIPKNPTTNPSWEDISFDIKDVVRHELEHLTQGGLNLKGGAGDEDPKLRRPSKQMADDQLIRDLIDADMLPKSQYYKLEKEVDAMLQGLYFKAKKTKRPFKDVINDYLDIFIKQKTISLNDKEDILDLWRSRGKALSLPIFENQKQNMDYKIYSDMDGVLVDFEKGYEKLTGIDLKGEYRPDGEDFWKPIEQAGVGYWAGLEWMSDGKQLWSYLKPFNPVLLSAPSRSQSSRIGKHVWVKHKLPGTKLILRYASQKQELATPESILIDDRQVNIDQWEAAGGIGILHTSTDNTIKQLKQLGL